jgi:prepilin-type N-terminal cleavage/methylation domain-containing protein
MKRAFTLLELIMVIVIIGILAAVVMPRLNSDRMQKAANLFKNTMRYTQHLALIDDKYIPSPTLSNYTDAMRAKKETRQWFKKWWTFMIWRDDGSSNDSCGQDGPGLRVFSDKPTSGDNYDYNNEPSKSESAVDPVDKELITICLSNNNGYISNEKYNLNKRFGIEKIVIDSPCNNLKNYIAFDELGRPHCVFSRGSDELTPYKNILKSKIKYTLCGDSDCEENVSVCLFPYTGFITNCD